MDALGVPPAWRHRFFAGHVRYRDDGGPTETRTPGSKYRTIGDGLWILPQEMELFAVDLEVIRDRIAAGEIGLVDHTGAQPKAGRWDPARVGPFVSFPYEVSDERLPYFRQFWRVRFSLLDRAPRLWVEVNWRPGWTFPTSGLFDLVSDPSDDDVLAVLRGARTLVGDLTRRGIKATYDSAADLEADIRRAARELIAELRNPEITVDLLLGKLPIGRSAFYDAQQLHRVRWRQVVRSMGGRVKR